MALIEKEISLILSSATENGAKNKSSDGSSFSVHFQEPIEIPKNALNPTLTVEESTIWWSIPNVLTPVNNKLYITGPDKNDVVTNFTIEIPQGLYDLNLLNDAIKRELENKNAKNSDGVLISLSPDTATNQVELIVNYTNVSVDFSQDETLRDLLGFKNEVYPAPATAPHTYTADKVADFNHVNYFLLHCDLVSRGIRINDKYNQTISQVLIDVLPGSQIHNTPFHPAKLDVSELIDTKRSDIMVWLTDDKNRPINTNGEDFSCRVVLRYSLKI